MSQGRVMRYGVEQLRDWLLVRGVGIILLLGIGVAGAAVEKHARFGDGWMVGPAGAAHVLQMVLGMLEGQALLIAVVATSGIISNDRKAGFQRFYFAKPVSPPAYYGQAFVVALIGVFVTVAIFLGGIAIMWQPVVPWGAILGLYTTLLGVGGLVFLLSSLVQLDVIGVGVLMAAGALLPPFLNTFVPPLAPYLLAIFPPILLMGELRGILADGIRPPWNLVTLVLGYGLGCFALGLLVLRRRALTS